MKVWARYPMNGQWSWGWLDADAARDTIRDCRQFGVLLSCFNERTDQHYELHPGWLRA